MPVGYNTLDWTGLLLAYLPFRSYALAVATLQTPASPAFHAYDPHSVVANDETLSKYASREKKRRARVMARKTNMIRSRWLGGRCVDLGTDRTFHNKVYEFV